MKWIDTPTTIAHTNRADRLPKQCNRRYSKTRPKKAPRIPKPISHRMTDAEFQAAIEPPHRWYYDHYVIGKVVEEYALDFRGNWIKIEK